MGRPKETKTNPGNINGDAWLLVRVAKPDICHLRYTLEAYEGLCVPTTLPGGNGMVRLTTSKGLIAELVRAIEGIAKEVEVEIIERGEGEP